MTYIPAKDGQPIKLKKTTGTFLLKRVDWRNNAISIEDKYFTALPKVVVMDARIGEESITIKLNHQLTRKAFSDHILGGATKMDYVHQGRAFCS